MNKFFNIVGIYAVCVLIHEAIEYVAEPIDIYLKNSFNEKFKEMKEEKRKSYNIGDKKAGKPVEKIGF